LFNLAGILRALILFIRNKSHSFLIHPDAAAASKRDPGLAQR
jgi:hypothetical protein